MMRAENAALAPPGITCTTRNKEAANRSGLDAVWNAATCGSPCHSSIALSFQRLGQRHPWRKVSSVLVRFRR
jgi:hypothetical protein